MTKPKESDETYDGEEQYDADKDEILQVLNNHKEPNRRLVVLQVYFNQILKIDEQKQTVELDLFTRSHWKDPNWEGKTDEEFQEKKDTVEWDPTIEVINGMGLSTNTNELWLDYEQEGILSRAQRLIGNLSIDLNLQEFPFDTQVIKVEIESFWYFQEDMLLAVLPSQQHQTDTKYITLRKDVHLPEWIVESVENFERPNRVSFEKKTYSMLESHLIIRRRLSYYFSKIYLTLILTTVLAWSVFFIPSTDLSGRTSILVTLFLAAVALNFVAGSTLPKVSYSTQMDYYIVINYMFLFLIEIECIVAYQWQELNLDVILGSSIAALYVIYNCVYFLANIIRRKSPANLRPRPSQPISLLHTENTTKEKKLTINSINKEQKMAHEEDVQDDDEQKLPQEDEALEEQKLKTKD